MNANNSRIHHTATAWVLRWASIYTRGLPVEVANGRRDELASDLHEHSASAGSSPRNRRTLAGEITARAILGIGADLAWREHQLHREQNRRMMSLPPRPRASAHRALVGSYVLASVMIAIGLVAAVRTALNVSYASSPQAPVVLGALTLLAVLALLLFSRASSRLTGGIGLAVLTVPIGWTLTAALPSISAHASQIYGFALQPFAQLSLPLALGIMLLPELAVAAWFLYATIRLRRLVAQT
jgi:hypothetical protein